MERQMDEMNCVGIHCFAEAHSCTMLEERSMDFILQHFCTVCQQVREGIQMDGERGDGWMMVWKECRGGKGMS